MEKSLQTNDTVNLSLSKNIKVLSIDGIRFEMNLDDPEVYKALFDFKKNHDYDSMNESDDIDLLLNDCESTIDAVLGEGTCNKLFSAKDMKMYLLVNELANIFLENFMKEEQEKAKARNKEEVEQLEKILDSMSNIAKMMEYADNKYRNRGNNNYVPNRRANRKHKGKK